MEHISYHFSRFFFSCLLVCQPNGTQRARRINTDSHKKKEKWFEKNTRNANVHAPTTSNLLHSYGTIIHYYRIFCSIFSLFVSLCRSPFTIWSLNFSLPTVFFFFFFVVFFYSLLLATLDTTFSKTNRINLKYLTQHLRSTILAANFPRYAEVYWRSEWIRASKKRIGIYPLSKFVFSFYKKTNEKEEEKLVAASKTRRTTKMIQWNDT